ncbi:MAG TPA: energy transducer TonB [Spirochaetota bacterium]|nr:energy transducer TonB [Spirochaetota bacterium]
MKARETILKIWKTFVVWESRHPYGFSFLVSALFMGFLLFSGESLEINSEDLIPMENIQFIDMETVQAPRRIVKKDLSIDKSDTAEDSADAERAVGVSDDPNAVDLAFFPNIAPPRPVGKLEKRYPKIASEMNVEAVINVELLISSNGKVRNVSILGIRLSKALPSEIHAKIAKEFARDAKIILMGAQFSPPVVNGKRVPIRMEMPLKFRLEV